MYQVSVVIPNYNGKALLYDCLKTLPQSECFEIIVVDNGSDDGSIDMLNEEFPYVVKICNADNLGFSAAVNMGIKAARAPYVVLLNNDTKVEEGFLEALQEVLDKDPRIFSASSCMVSMKEPDIIDDTGDYYNALGWAFTLGKGKNVKKYQKARKVFSACGGASIYRKEVFEQIGYFDENHFAYLEDVDVGFRSQIYGYKNVYINRAVCHHVGSAYSGSRYNPFKIQLSAQNSIYIVYKNMPLLMFIINLPFLLLGFLVKILFFTLKGQIKPYFAGLGKGFKLCFSKKGRAKKVRFSFKHLGNYCKIQGNLWLNLFRRFINS